MATYVNPLKSIRNLQMGRTDQGVDASGTGPVLAMGSGKVLSTHNSGWPGGGFIVIALDNPIGGHGAYYTAEDVTPTVSVGQRVKAGQQIGTAYAGATGLELGWAATGSQLGESYAMAHGGYTEGQATSAGANFKSVLDTLMSGKQPAGGKTGSTSGTSTGSGATPATLTADTTPANGTGATGAGCLSLVAFPVLLPWLLLRAGGRAVVNHHEHLRPGPGEVQRTQVGPLAPVAAVPYRD